MNKKSIISLWTLLVCAFLPFFISSCGSDDNTDFNIYFVGVGDDTNQNFYDNEALQKIVSTDLSTLNGKWQTTIMNEKDARNEFDKFSGDLEKKLETQVREGKLKIKGETYFTLVLSHSVKPGQEYPVISTYKITLSGTEC